MRSFVFFFFLACASQLEAAKDMPMQATKVMEMLSKLEATVIAEGETADKQYKEFVTMIEDSITKKGFAITTAEKEIEELKATIDKATGTISTLGSKIEELAGTISTDEADLAAATKVRETEAAEFLAEKKELEETMNVLSRAIAILEREMSKLPSASMLQLPNAASVTQALAALVQASVLSSTDASKVTALVQTSQGAEDGDEEPGAPAAAVYESKSGGIISTLEGLMEKAQSQLSEAQKAETTSIHNYAMLKQSVEDEIKFSTKSMEEKKADLVATKETLAAAEGDLDMTTKGLAADKEALAAAETSKADKAAEYEARKKSLAEELAALAKAKEVLAGAAGAAVQTYGFLQTSRTHLSTGVELANFEAVRFVRDLAQRDGSKALVQLASRMASLVRHGALTGEDPFAKVKSMISAMIDKLVEEAGKAAEHKAYCDKETKETTEKKEAKQEDVDKLQTKLDSTTAKAAKLKEELKELSEEIASMNEGFAEYTALRQEEHATYSKNAPEMKAGIEAVKQAIVILKDYYTEGKARAGAAGGVISFLEVAEADFSKGLAQMEEEETSAAADYEKSSQEYKLNLAVLEKDVEYKTKEEGELQKTLTELGGDLESMQTELDAILEYAVKLKEMCTAKAEPYEAKKARRDKEIAGLKEALTILEGEAALMQKSKRMLRGSQA